MKLKGIDIFCASQASTAICFSMDQASSSSSVIQLGGRAIDRHNPIIQDSRRSSTSTRFINPPCYSHPPINPKTYHQLQKSKKNSSSSKPVSDQSKKKIVSFSKEKYEQKRKSTSNGKKPTDDNVKKYSSVPSGSVVRKSCAEPVDLISTTPPGSSRYLLSDKVFFDGLSDIYDPVLALVPVGNEKNQNTVMNNQEYESASSASSSSSLSKPPPPSNQVCTNFSIF